MSNFVHIPVLLKAAVDGLNVCPGKVFIDGTAGGGGHTQEILKRGGKVLAIDCDTDAIEHLRDVFKNEKMVKIVKGNFSKIGQIVRENGFFPVDGVLFDLGFSSYQIDEAGRGFSFRKDEKIDMRMDSDTTLTAFDIVNTWSKDALYELFSKVGEEHDAQKIADEIVFVRKNGNIEISRELGDIVKKVKKEYGGMMHPATKVFQALRITVNNELENLKTGLFEGVSVLRKNGRFGVISFHSLEDRIVKMEFLSFEKNGIGRIITKKPITADDKEIENNVRSRSAKLRFFEIV